LHKEKNKFMKTLNTLVMIDSQTNLDIFNSIANDFNGYQFTHTDIMEEAIEAAHAHRFDLLILDKNLSKANAAKLNKLIELIYPEAATLELHLNDESFIRFKLTAMLRKWEDVNADPTVRFMD